MSNRKYGIRWLSRHIRSTEEPKSTSIQNPIQNNRNSKNFLSVVTGFVVITLFAIILGKSVNLRIENSVIKIDWSVFDSDGPKPQNSK
jgi:hypothetical protein